MRIKHITSKSILTESKLPDTDYVINPYVGCQFGCTYCYASFMGRFVGEPKDAWGDYVYVKTNAVKLFREEILRLMRKHSQATILMSSVTDPYQAIESKYKITRGILEELVRLKYPGLVSILTKSPSVLRDKDLLLQLPNAEIGFTVTTSDDHLASLFEGESPPPSKRFKALDELKKLGLKTYAFVGPLLPHFYHKPDLLESLFEKLSQVKVDSLFVEQLNLSPYIKSRFYDCLNKHAFNHLHHFNEALSAHDYKERLNFIVKNLLNKYALRLRLNKVLTHK